MKENNYIIGSFYWAGVDYLGESFGYPCKGWTASILDSTGADRPFTAQSRALFRPNIPFVSFAVLDEKQPFEYASSTWSFPKSSSHMMIDRKYGEIVQAVTFTTCESVELIVGDRSYGEKYLLEYRDNMIPWNIVWEKKQVTMIGKNHGNEVCRQIVNVFDEPFTFDVQFNKNKLSDYIHDLYFIEIQILDQDLRPNYNADTLLSISLSDELELLGVDNGDLCSHHNYKGHELRVYKGKGLVIVRGRKKGVGTVQIQAPELSTIKKVEIKVFPSTQQ